MYIGLDPADPLLKEPLSKSAVFEEIEPCARAGVTVDDAELGSANNFAAALKPVDGAFACVGGL